MRCPCCGWGEIARDDVDGAEMCPDCVESVEAAQTEERSEKKKTKKKAVAA